MMPLTLNPAGTESRLEIANGHDLLELARGWLKQGNPAVAAELLDSALRSPDADQDSLLRAHILKETGRVHMMQSEGSPAEHCYLEAQRLFLAHQHYQGAAECARNRANALFQAGQFSQAEDLCRQALDWASRAGRFELRATILNTMAAIQSEQGCPEDAIGTFRLCLSDFRTAGNLIRQGYVLLNIGLAQIDLGRHREAHDSLNQALSIAMREKDQSLVEICYQNIARCYLGNGDAHLARSVVQTARKILPGLNSKALEMEWALLDARVTRVQGDLEGARSRLEALLPEVGSYALDGLRADVLLEQAHVARAGGDTQLAIAKAETALSQFSSLGAVKRKLEAEKFLHEVKDRGHNAQATHAYGL